MRKCLVGSNPTLSAYPDGFSPTEPRDIHQVEFTVARAADGYWFSDVRLRLMVDADWQRLGLTPRQPVCY